jgi:hypothetical protein
VAERDGLRGDAARKGISRQFRDKRVSSTTPTARFSSTRQLRAKTKSDASHIALDMSYQLPKLCVFNIARPDWSQYPPLLQESSPRFYRNRMSQQLSVSVPDRHSCQLLSPRKLHPLVQIP